MHDKSMTTSAALGGKRGKPVAVVRQGSTSVPIYKGTCRGVTRFTLSFYHNGIRRRRSFGKLDAAKEEARLIALKIQRGMGGENDLRPQERESYLAAVRMLEPLGLPLLGAVEDYMECRRRLGVIPLLSAVAEYLVRHEGFESGVAVPRIVGEFIETKVRDRASKRYVECIKDVLGKFSESFPGGIDEVTARQVEAWLRRGDQSANTRNGWLKRVKTLFEFAKGSGYLPANQPTAVEKMKRSKTADSDVGILTPAQMRVLLEEAGSEERAFLAIGGFAGLRVSEICRLDWSAVSLERRLIELRAGQAKTASRRIVPVSDNLAAWLAPLERQGALVPGEGVVVRTHNLARALGFVWPPNGLRHSYISYRIAEVKNAAQVALEAGNSPSIIFKHYRELVTEAEAKEWFGIFPTGRIDSGDSAS
jgi:integrase